MCGYGTREALALLTFSGHKEACMMPLKQVAGGRFVAGGAHGMERGGIVDTHAVVAVADV